METEIKISFFRRVKMSMLDFDKYHIIASEGLGRAMFYFIKLMLLFSLILSCAFLGKTMKIINEGISYVDKEIPNFYFTENKLFIDIEEDYVLENHQYIDFKLILSNSENYEKDITDFDGIVVVLSRNKALLKGQNSTSTVIRTYDELNENNITEFDKNSLISYFNESGYSIYANIFAVVFIVIFLMNFLTAILDTLALSVVGYLVSRMIRIPLKYSAIYNLSISAMTLPIILNVIYIILNLFTGFVIPYFQIMYTLVSYICLIAALLIMRSEITKKKVQIKVEIMNEIQKQEEKEDSEDNENQEKEPKEDNKSDKKEDLKDKVNGKINKNKDKPEPQANIKEQ